MPQVVPITKKLVKTVSYSANGSDSLDIPSSGYITRMVVFCDLNVTTASGGAVADEDGFLKFIEYIRFLSSSRVYASIADLRLWYYYMYSKFRGGVQLDTLPTAGGTTGTYRFMIPVHTGRNKLEEFDKTSIIPAAEEDDLRMEIKFKQASDLGTGYTINSATVGLIISKLVLEGVSKAAVWNEGVLPLTVWNTTTKIIDGEYTAYTLEKEMPVGRTLIDSLVMVVDASNDRSSALVTEYNVQLADVDGRPFDRSWRAAEAEFQSNHGLQANTSGIALVDWSKVSLRPSGLPLEYAQRGSVVFGMTTAAAAAGWVKFLHAEGTFI